VEGDLVNAQMQHKRSASHGNASSSCEIIISRLALKNVERVSALQIRWRLVLEGPIKRQSYLGCYNTFSAFHPVMILLTVSNFKIFQKNDKDTIKMLQRCQRDS
jgi:hypothetical protein